MRIQNSIRNIVFGLGGQVIAQLMNFINRTIFIYMLGIDYLGVSGLFTNILSILSLAELGIGSAIIYNMYKPLAEDNKPKIKALMSLYAKAYKIIGCIIAIIGVGLTPFLDVIIKDQPNINHLTIIYWLFLLNTMSSYFFAYKRAIISADQKEYINTINDQKFNLIRNIVQIACLFLTKNYLLFLLIQVAFTWISNMVIARKANQMYPFLKEGETEELSKAEKKTILKNVCALVSQKIGSVAVNGTDNLLISACIGIYYVGITSNYYMITSLLNAFIMPIFTALTASIGNLNAGEDKEKSYRIYNVIWFMNFWLYGMCAIILIIIVAPFIRLWIGEQYLLSEIVTFMFVVNFFIMGMRKTNITHINTMGLFWHERYKPLFEAAINLGVSILLLNYLGLIGVFLGTFISTITTSFWVEPYILHKFGFKRSIKGYVKKCIYYTVIVIVAGIISIGITQFISGHSFIWLIVKGLVTLVITNALFLLFLCRTQEFKYLWDLVLKILKGKLIR